MNSRPFAKTRSALIIGALTLATLLPAGAQLTAQLGILDLTANGGINPATGNLWQPGDQYRFIFASGAGRHATTTDIAEYNDFVQNAADASLLNIGTAQGVTWKAVASTPTVAANVNTGTDTGPGVSIWLLNGTSLVADDYADLYGSATHSSVINVSETGGTPFDGGDFTSVWTGSDSSGGIAANDALGAGDGNSRTGLWNFTSGAHWINRFSIDNSTVKGLYGMSELLTVMGSVETDPPTLISIVDDKSGGPIEDTESVTYTVTFSEAMNASTVEIGDFDNSAAPPATINSVSTTGDPAVFEVSVSPGGPGALQLQIVAGAIMEDLVGNELDTTSALPDDTVITVNADNTAPTLNSFANNVPGGTIFETAAVTYTLTFSEGMNALTIETTDFENAGSPAATITSVSATGDPAVFTVLVNPGGVGTIQLQVKTGANLEDLGGNALDTTSAITDSAVINVIALPDGGQLGILDLENANGGINPATGEAWKPGDKYRYIFASSTGHHATTTDIAVYNTFIQNSANVSPLGLGSVSWKALASTETVDARDNTSTNTGVDGTGVPILLLDGTTKIADDYFDFWDGHTSAEAIDVSETGGSPFDNGGFTSLWTGTAPDGTGQNNDQLGAGDGTSLVGLWGGAASASQWITRFGNIDQTTAGNSGDGTYALYGMSEILTISGTIVSDDYDAWAALYAPADLTDPDADLDGDGSTNNEERLFGTDPTDPSSVNPYPTGLFDSTAFTFSYTRRDDSLTNLKYIVETASDAKMWVEDTGAVQVVGDAATTANNMIETIEVTLSPALLAASNLQARVRTSPPPTLLSENFESDDGGFTVSTDAGTDWEHGDPDSVGEFGGSVTMGNGGSANCWGTNLGVFSTTTTPTGEQRGYYAQTTVTCLRSTVIDLTSVAGAQLLFAEALDLEQDQTVMDGVKDIAVVNIIDDTSDTIIDADVYFATDTDDTTADWNIANGGTPIDLTPYVGQAIRIEWCLTGFGGAAGDYLGWYIDDVIVTETIP